MTEAMRTAAHATLDATPRPRVVIAVGDCACGTGPWRDAPAAGLGAVVELGATIEIPGCPPPPDALRAGLRAAAEQLEDR
jgi:Ni,Fe-hydrogenase III small subunit